jgi:hypothetical protein
MNVYQIHINKLENELCNKHRCLAQWQVSDSYRTWLIEHSTSHQLKILLAWFNENFKILNTQKIAYIMKKSIIYIIGLMILSACRNQSQKNNYNHSTTNSFSPTQTNTFDTNYNTESTEIITYSPHENTHYQNDENLNYTIQDLWGEADLIRSEAESIMSEAEDIGCDIAIREAQNAISFSDECMSTNNYNDAESYLEDAQSELSNSKSYLEDCLYDQENNGDETEE